MSWAGLRQMEQSAASTPGRRRVAAAVAGLAVSCGVLAGALAIPAEAASWHCDKYDIELPRKPEYRSCELPHDPNGSGRLMLWVWQPAFNVPLTLFNPSRHEAKVETWSFGILRDTRRLSMQFGQDIYVRTGDRVWGRGTDGEVGVRMSYPRYRGEEPGPGP